MKLRVVKVGGSLFDWDELPRALEHWLRHEDERPTLLIAGGGAHADLVRAADRRWQLDPEVAHLLALRSMSLNSRLLAALLAPCWPCAILANHADLARWLTPPASGGTAAVELESILAEEERRSGRSLVERSWRVTSDSLAAWLGSLLAAVGHDVELVLLKSTNSEPHTPLADLQRAGVVDECLEEHAAGVEGVRLVNLRGVRDVVR